VTDPDRTTDPIAGPTSAGPPVAAATAADGARAYRALREAVAVAVVGADEPLRLLSIALLADGHALIEDVPGVGKTLLARAFALALGLDFGRIQGTPDLLPSDVTGASILDGTPTSGMSLRFVEGPVFTNVLLVDEINRATPRTQSALLEAMQERQVSVEGVTRPLPDPFLVLATQNPIEYEGTFALPEAQLDRFMLRLRLGYPDAAGERRIAGRYRLAVEPLAAVPRVLGADRVAGLREGVRLVRVADELTDYLVAIVAGTRDRPEVELGGSPRASVALFRAAQASAFLDGRDFVLPDDIRAIAPAVLGHRLRVDLDSSLHGATAERVLADVIGAIPVPVDDPRDRPG
jgi:MoxR-like ATPase